MSSEAGQIDALRLARKAIAEKVRALRVARHWSQAELADRLNLSQSRLSEIERGAGSFTAEQFLEILKLFNVDVGEFSSVEPREAEVQNALARLGARHLYEASDVLPSGRMKEATEVVREVLVDARNPRHVTALAPVLVKNADAVNLHRIQMDLAAIGLEGRLPWLVENVLYALRLPEGKAQPRSSKQQTHRAELILELFLEAALSVVEPKRREASKDLLDHNIRSLRSYHLLQEQLSPISQRWRIVTSLQPADFALALRDSYGLD